MHNTRQVKDLIQKKAIKVCLCRSLPLPRGKKKRKNERNEKKREKQEKKTRKRQKRRSLFGFRSCLEIPALKASMQEYTKEGSLFQNLPSLKIRIKKMKTASGRLTRNLRLHDACHLHIWIYFCAHGSQNLTIEAEFLVNFFFVV